MDAATAGPVGLEIVQTDEILAAGMTYHHISTVVKVGLAWWHSRQCYTCVVQRPAYNDSASSSWFWLVDIVIVRVLWSIVGGGCLTASS
jgi:hypothetical protein